MSPVIGVKVKFNRKRSGSMGDLLTANRAIRSTHKFKSTPALSSISPSARRKKLVTAAAAERVTFVVGQKRQKFRIHPSALTSNSDVFKKMLEAPQWSPARDGEAIEIVDVKPEAFRVLLMSLAYGVKSIQKLLNMTLALDTYYAAHKYNLVELEDCLVKFVQRHANPENILELLNHAEFYGLKIVEGYCWSMIERHTLQVVRSEAFAYAKWDHLCGILENSRLTIGEYDLFQGVMRWCSTEARRPQNYGKNLYELIGVAVYKLRFPLMTSSEFDLVIRTGILKAGEIADLQSNFKRNTTFSHQIRRYDCYCRRYHMTCKLCTCDHSPSIPVDGRISNSKVAKKEFQHPISPTSLPTLVIDENGNHENHHLKVEKANQEERFCECLKYSSCPAYPNGVSAAIMMALNLHH